MLHIMLCCRRCHLLQHRWRTSAPQGWPRPRFHEYLPRRQPQPRLAARRRACAGRHHQVRAQHLGAPQGADQPRQYCAFRSCGTIVVSAAMGSWVMRQCPVGGLDCLTGLPEHDWRLASQLPVHVDGGRGGHGTFRHLMLDGFWITFTVLPLIRNQISVNCFRILYRSRCRC